MPQPRPNPTRPAPPSPKPEFDPIDPVWLLKAIGYTILAALFCGYLTLCLLFYQGQWQLILHPSRSSSPLTAIGALPAQPIRFDATASGVPRLSGALLSTSAGAKHAGYTVLYLREGDSALAESAIDAQNIGSLSSLGIDVFAFDYRGYGLSDPTHPTQLRMQEDASAALRYLHDVRSIADPYIVLFGRGVGASLAIDLAQRHPALRAIILDSPPSPSPMTTVLADPRVRFLPVKVLFNEAFTLDALAAIRIPKLLIHESTSAPSTMQAFESAPNPKMTLQLRPGDTQNRAEGISRFLDQYLGMAAGGIKE